MAKPEKKKPHPYDVVRRAREQGIREVIVGVSCGKDSLAALDVCAQHFDRVAAYFMYFVKGLSFQEKHLAYLERRYKLQIMRLPHWALSKLYRSAAFRHATAASRNMHVVKMRDIDAYVRKQTGIHWIATGEKTGDSLERNAQIRNCQGINDKRGRLFPVATWTDAEVMSYLRQRNILLPPDYNFLPEGRSFGSLWASQIVPLRERYPEDYARIAKQFPLLDAQVQRHEQTQRRKNRS